MALAMWAAAAGVMVYAVSPAEGGPVPVAPTLVPLPDPLPSPVVHTYNIVFTDGEKSSLPGTEIRYPGGYCVEIVLGDRVDTVVCGVRYVTEAVPEPAQHPESGPGLLPQGDPEPGVARR